MGEAEREGKIEERGHVGTQIIPGTRAHLRVPVFFLYLHLQVLIPYVAKDNPCCGDGPVLIPYSSALAFSVSRAEFDCGCKMACKSS